MLIIVVVGIALPLLAFGFLRLVLGFHLDSLRLALLYVRLEHVAERRWSQLEVAGTCEGRGRREGERSEE